MVKWWRGSPKRQHSVGIDIIRISNSIKVIKKTQHVAVNNNYNSCRLQYDYHQFHFPWYCDYVQVVVALLILANLLDFRFKIQSLEFNIWILLCTKLAEDVSCSDNVFIALFLSGMLTPTLAINSMINYTGPTSGRSMPSHTVGVSTYENHIKRHSLPAEGSAQECKHLAVMQLYYIKWQ